jgi:hypothetical protein
MEIEWEGYDILECFLVSMKFLLLIVLHKLKIKNYFVWKEFFYQQSNNKFIMCLNLVNG